MPRYAHITGWGMVVPEKVMTNQELARLVETSDEWIQSRTGIRERRVAGPRETTASLGVRAAQAALEIADLDPAELDLIIVATSTPEHVFPATACLVQDALGAVKAGAFDLSAACTGFIYALSLGAQSIRAGGAEKVLVIGSETLSKIVNWRDRGTCILFGDGAGAVVLEGSDQPGGVLGSVLRSDGSGADSLSVPAGGSRLPTSFETVRDNQHFIHMDGKEVYRFATRVMAQATREAAQAAGLSLAEVQLVIPHQANRRIIESAARGLDLPEERFFVNLDRYGNTSTASIPIALCEAVAQGRLRPNDHVVFVGFGAGLTWGAIVLKWDVTPVVEITQWQHLRRQTRYGLARVRSAVLRRVRRLEALLYGRQAGEGDGANGQRK